MPTVDATVGGASANSYALVADADTYFDERLHATAWTGATADDKARALIWATRMLDDLDWLGSAAATTQALRWPRTGVYDRENDLISSSVIPDDIKEALYEQALQLIGSDLTAPAGESGFSRIRVDVIELEMARSDRTPRLVSEVFTRLDHYLVAGGQTLLVRV